MNAMAMTSNVTLFPLDKYDFNKCIKQEEGK